ncbi:MAG: hypothetical protein JXR76_03745 [Deltaproteobacteria bacterium]|nr:hypothetical protein [Deltaproteobacteria bacterium]
MRCLLLVWFVFTGSLSVMFGCNHVGTADHESAQKTDEEDDNEEDDNSGDECRAGQQRCDGDVALWCRNGKWKSEDCAEKKQICVDDDDQVICQSSNSRDKQKDTGDESGDDDDEKTSDKEDDDNDGDENDTVTRDDTDDPEHSDENDSDSGDDDDRDDPELWVVASESECEVEGQSCYQDCWYCALHGMCSDLVDECTNHYENGTGCSVYFSCISRDCCAGDECLEGDEWAQCTLNCQVENNTSPVGLSLWHKISKCVVCDACPVSCAAEYRDDFHICVDETLINSPDAVCFEEEEEEGIESCYSWAGWGGPCTPWVQECYNDAACWRLQDCYTKSFDADNYKDAQQKCFDAAGAAATEKFWAQRSCIFCQACDIICGEYAIGPVCDDYEEMY